MADEIYVDGLHLSFDPEGWLILRIDDQTKLLTPDEVDEMLDFLLKHFASSSDF